MPLTRPKETPKQTDIVNSSQWYVCMYVPCKPVCHCIHTYMYVRTSNLHLCTDLWPISMHLGLCACIHMYLYMCNYVCMYYVYVVMQVLNATVRMLQTLLISNNGAALVLSNDDTVHLQLQETLHQKEQRYEEEIGATLVSVYEPASASLWLWPCGTCIAQPVVAKSTQ